MSVGRKRGGCDIAAEDVAIIVHGSGDDVEGKGNGDGAGVRRRFSEAGRKEQRASCGRTGDIATELFLAWRGVITVAVLLRRTAWHDCTDTIRLERAHTRVTNPTITFHPYSFLSQYLALASDV